MRVSACVGTSVCVIVCCLYVCVLVRVINEEIIILDECNKTWVRHVKVIVHNCLLSGIIEYLHNVHMCVCIHVYVQVECVMCVFPRHSRGGRNRFGRISKRAG